MKRLADIVRFYSLLDRLGHQIGGERTLGACTGRMDWPKRGVYFFFERGETRSDSGSGPRVVRIGTHALSEGSGTTLWKRLSQHQGVLRDGGGNHRGSIFRLIVGTALAARGEGVPPPIWGQGNTASSEIRKGEQDHEIRVSEVIRAMPFMWLPIDDEHGANSGRGFVERNTIALLSNHTRAQIDPPSARWLGHECNRVRVRGSGLWNQNHVEENHDPAFLDVFEELVKAGAR